MAVYQNMIGRLGHHGACPYVNGGHLVGHHSIIPGLLGAVFIVLFLTLAIIGTIILIRLITKQVKPAIVGTTPQSNNNEALDILKKRYAQGELTKKEYEAIRKDLL